MTAFRRGSAFIALWVAASAVCTGCSERREVSYRVLADAIAAGETTRGWIPDWLPQSSGPIELAYAPESSRTWCAFKFSLSDAQRLREKLGRSVSSSNRRIENPGLSWWPVYLTGDLDDERLRETHFELYSMMEPGVGDGIVLVIVAINWRAATGFFYRS